jgi:predicted ATPase/transcriptional regulator with XRE-family HTH domain/Tfp pilus assembly protein PilF
MAAEPPGTAGSFGTLLKRYRLTASLTQEGLAERAGISARAVSDLERDAGRTPRQDTVLLLAEALGLDATHRARFIAAAHPEVALPAPPPAPLTEPEPFYVHTLPVAPTPLIGRDQDLAQVVALFTQPAVRLVTLTGPGGVGKTRLALAVAEQLATIGVPSCWIDLSPLRDATVVAFSIATMLGLQPVGNQSGETLLLHQLRASRLLLVLDNFEQVLAAITLLSKLLAGCPDLRLLVTSRAALHLRGEYEVSVPPLPVPSVRRLLPPAELASVPSVALFLARAQAVAPDVRLTAASGPAIAEICRRLDGLPLALELAAARSKLLPPPALLARLASRLGLLIGGKRDGPARQQTLRAALAWSYDLLSEAEQHLFRWLAVFAGSWSLEAAEIVCARSGVDDVLGVLGALLDQSLVQRREGSVAEPRYSMLETVREYALEQSAACGDLAPARQAHAAYFSAFFEEAERGLVGPDQAHWLALLEREHDNVRAVLAWSLDEQPALRADTSTTPSPALVPEPREVGMRLASAIWRFWHVHGHVTEGRVWLRRLLEQPLTCVEHDRATALRAKVLAAAATLATEQGDHTQAVTLAGESLEHYRTLGDQRRVAVVLNILGAAFMRLGDYLRATTLYEESLALFRTLAIPQSIATVLNNLGTVARYQEDYVRAKTLFEESLAIKRGLADARGIATALNNLGEIALDRGDLDRAAQLFEQSLGLFRQQDGQWGIALLLTNLAEVARAQGDSARAAHLYRQSLGLYRDQQNHLDVGECLEGIAALACACGEPARAVHLLAATAALRATLGMPMPPVERAGYEHVLAVARAAISAAAFDAAWTTGQVSSLEDAITYALTWEPSDLRSTDRSPVQGSD